MTPLVKYQEEVVDGLRDLLERRQPRAISLVAPTGSGKTLILTRTLDAVTTDLAPKTVWIWLAPFEVIVEQTTVTLQRESKNLALRALDRERRREGFIPGEVYLATSQFVASSTSSVHVAKEREPTLSEMADAVHARGFRLGLVLDEAHIGVDADTVLGRRIARMRPDIIIAATATPKDARLAATMEAAGAPRPLTITIGRRDVVRCGLNKKHLLAMRILTGADQTMAREFGVRAMIHHAVQCRTRVHDALRRNGSDLVPLLLAQADNGDESATRIEQALLASGLSSSSIRKYLERDKTDGALADMAADPEVAVIIFKVAAGTGFDAPRAWILASDRTVQDRDTAVQFVGRIMRVPGAVRDIEKTGKVSPEDLRVLQTAFLFTRDSEGQQAYRSAATMLKALSTEIDFVEQDVDVLDAYLPQPDGQVEISRGPLRPAPQGGADEDCGHYLGPLFARPSGEDYRAFRSSGDAMALLGIRPERIVESDSARAKRARTPGPITGGYETHIELQDDLEAQGLQGWFLRTIEGAPTRFWQEDWPLLSNYDTLIEKVIQTFGPKADDLRELVRVARGDWHGVARFEDFFTDEIKDQQFVVTDPAAISRLAEQNARYHFGTLRTLSDSGAQDRILNGFRRKLSALDLKLGRQELGTLSRLVVPLAMPGMREAESVFLSRDVQAVPADALPGLIVLPRGLNRINSIHALYGALPPTKEELQDAAAGLASIMAAWHDVDVRVGDRTFRAERVDEALAMNVSEGLLVDMLDRLEGIRWWARNPDRKRWSARVLRIDGRGRFFYPDFVVNLRSCSPDDMRLLETKHDAIDIEAKRRRGSTPSYGEVVFLFTDGETLRLVGSDGTFGRTIPADDRDLLVAALNAASPSK